MLNLSQVTLVFAADNRIEETSLAVNRSVQQVNFARTLWLSSKQPPNENADWIKVVPIDSGEKYNKLILKNLNQYVETPFCIISQWDGFVVNPFAWTDEFYYYDYIGAPWNDTNTISYGGTLHDRFRVGNGGFSLRSKRLLERCAEVPFEEYQPEDCMIVKRYRNYFSDMRFAPVDVANRFSQDDWGYGYGGVNAFGFHGINKLEKFN